MLFIGDSLTFQLYESWRARLRNERYAKGADAGNAWCNGRCEGAVPDLCSGHCAVKSNDYAQHSSHYSVCDNGATLMMAEGFRWVLSSESFTASDPRVARCARRIRNHPGDYGLEVIPHAHVAQMIAAAWRHTPVPPHGERLPVRRVAVVYNQMAHIHLFIRLVKECYASGNGMSEAAATSAAVRDVFRYWADDQARWAQLLANLTTGSAAPRGSVGEQRGDAAADARERQLPGPTAVYLRTSPPAADAFCVKPSGAPQEPIEPGALVHGVMTGHGEYSHQYVYWINDMMRAAFRAHGHGVVDHEAMLGARVDAYPCSQNGEGDKLHFCLPGPPDWALDSLVRQVTTGTRGGVSGGGGAGGGGGGRRAGIPIRR